MQNKRYTISKERQSCLEWYLAINPVEDRQEDGPQVR